MAGNKHLLHSFHHLLIGLILILKGSDKFQHHHLLGGLIFLFGVIIILCFIYILLKKDHSTSLAILVHLFEALVCLFTAYIFFEEGKKYLQYFFLFAAVGFFVSVVITYNKRKSKAH